MENKYLRTAFSVTLILAGYFLGFYNGTKQNTHICATYKQLGVEMVFDKSIAVKNADGQIIAVVAYDNLSEILNDESLAFHACKK